MGKVGKAIGFLALAATGFGAVGLGFAAAGTAAAAISSFVAQVALSAGLSSLALALAKKPRAPGITTQETQTGGSAPQSFIVGRYATGGQLMAPRMTHGKVGKTPNAFLTYVMAVSDVPGVRLSRVFIDGEVGVVGVTPHPDYGLPVTLKGVADRAWIKWYDGSQTTADPMLIAKYGSHPQRPWLADMIGTGLTYAILTFRFDRTLYRGFPTVRFEVDGIALYDPRADSSVGGSGAQRLASPATWAPTDNPVVMAYNIALGVPIPGGDTWGGGWQLADLPLNSWFAAMNVCDQPEPLAAGGFEPRYRAGLEITVDSEPADAMAELLKTCAGRTADIGGTMKISVGAPPPAVFTLTDSDIIATDAQSADLFPGLNETHNAVQATFPDPASLWQSADAPPRFDLVAEAEDGRRLVGDVSLPACPYPQQVQRLMAAWLADERRFRRHQVVLPTDYAALEPLDAIQWTSLRNGYSNKSFEVVEVTSEPGSLITVANIREVDASDYDWNATLEVPWIPPAPGGSLPATQAVPSFAVTPGVLDDQAGQPRRPVLILTWDGTEQDDVTALEWEVRRVGSVEVLTGSTSAVASGRLVVASGILPLTAYEARARFVAPRATSWTAWQPATTGAIFLTNTDFGVGGIAQVFKDAGLSAPQIVSSLPLPGPARFVGELVFLTTDNKLYRWTGSAWTAAVATTDLTGLIGAALIADGAVGARAMAIGDFSNLAENPGFEAATGWTFGSGYAYRTGGARTGLRCLQRDRAAASVDASSADNALIFSAAAGDRFFISAQVSMLAGAVTTVTGVRLRWLDAGNTAIGASAISMAGGSLTTAWQLLSGHVTAPAGAVFARVEVITGTHTAGVLLWDDVYCNRANVGQLVVDGEISGTKVTAGTMNADRIVANTITGGLMAAAGIITNSAQIGDATITGAKIVDLEVDTIKIKGNAVTVPVSAYTDGSILVGGVSDELVQSLAMTREGFATQIHASIKVLGTSNVSSPLIILRRDGVTIYQSSVRADDVASTFSVSFVDGNIAVGATTYAMRVSGAGENLSVSKRTLIANHIKR